MAPVKRTYRDTLLEKYVGATCVAEIPLTGLSTYVLSQHVTELVTPSGRPPSVNSLVMESSRISESAQLRRVDGAWWVSRLGGPLKVNHRDVDRHRLIAGDHITADAEQFQYMERTRSFHADLETERELVTRDDEGAWQVYADWLSERADPIGRCIASGTPEPAMLAGLPSHSSLDLHWRRGVLDAACVRLSAWPSRSELDTLHEVLAALGTLPVARFLRALRIEFGSGGLGTRERDVTRQAPPPLTEFGAMLVDSVGLLGATALRSLVLLPIWNPELARALAPLRNLSLDTPPAERVRAFRSPRIVRGAVATPLDPSQPLNVGPIRVSFSEATGWRADGPFASINGGSKSRALIPGDECLNAQGEVIFCFEADSL